MVITSIVVGALVPTTKVSFHSDPLGTAFALFIAALLTTELMMRRLMVVEMVVTMMSVCPLCTGHTITIT